MKAFLVGLSAAMLVGCVTTDIGNDTSAMQANYERWIEGIPMPATDAERSDLCKNLRVEIAKQQSIGQSASDLAPSGYQAADLRMRSGRNAALLQGKADQVGCSL
ncbi:hypothetical protein ACQ5SB_20655 [Stenotrophomonas geniculata]|uniref:hypothetical protein n=1 Tax=Stenotrophomonas TaxID=40323 RepID=UPI003D34B604